MYRTDWFRFQVRVQDGQLLRLDPVNISARRARPLEPRNNGSGRTELVRDVVTGGAKTRDTVVVPS